LSRRQNIKPSNTPAQDTHRLGETVLKITSHPDQADKAAYPQDINSSDLGEDERAEWQRSR
ncbi:MAG: hypothetical protein ACKPKO_20810, partial [Candidatus Fonsibacter sp.]